jgi:hypothetical protein
MKRWEQKASVARTDSELVLWYSKLIEECINTDPARAINFALDAYCSVSSILIFDRQEQISNLTLVLSTKYNALKESILKSRIANFDNAPETFGNLLLLIGF